MMNNSHNKSKSKFTDSFCNLTETENLEDQVDYLEDVESSEDKNIFHQRKDSNNKASDGKKTLNNSEEYDEYGLEQFYENRQGSIEEALRKKSNRSTSSLGAGINRPSLSLESERKLSARTGYIMNIAGNVNKSKSRESINTININRRNSNSKNKEKIADKTSATNKTSRASTPNRASINAMSYDEFNNKSIANNPKLDKASSYSSILNQKKSKTNRTPNNKRPTIISNTNSDRLTLKIKITHDNVEDITNKTRPITNTNSNSSTIANSINKFSKKTTSTQHHNNNSNNSISFNTFRKSSICSNLTNNIKPLNNYSTFLTIGSASTNKNTNSHPQLNCINQKTDENLLSHSDSQITDPKINDNVNINSMDNKSLDTLNPNIKFNSINAISFVSKNELIKLLDNNNDNNLINSNLTGRKMTLQSENVSKSIIDENYAETLNKICTKRKSIAYVKEDFYVKNVKWRKNIENKTSEIKELKDAEEMKMCSFTPKINKNSVEISSKWKNSDDFYTKNLKWKQQIENFNQNQHILKERKEYEECHFHPVNIEQKSEYKLEHDYIYKKNIEWLRQVNENRRLKSLEHQEEMKTKSKHESIRERMTRSQSYSSYRKNRISKDFYNENEEEKLRDELRDSNTPTNLLSSLRSREFSHLYKEIEKEKIDKELKDLKSLINSLKSALEENKFLFKDELFEHPVENIYLEKSSATKTQNIDMPLKTDKKDEEMDKYKLLIEKYDKEKREREKALLLKYSETNNEEY